MGTALLYAGVARLPLLSESYTSLALASGFASWSDAFDLRLVPQRPLQHLYFHALASWGLDRADLARLVPYGMHGLSCLLVWRLARQLGCSRSTAWLPLASFLAFPSAKALAWVAAISGPGRVLCVLAGLSVAIAHLRRPRAWTGAGLLGAQLLGLGFHQASIELAVLCVLCALAVGHESGQGPARAARRLLDPWVLAVLVGVAFYAFATAFLLPARYHGLAGAGTVLANAVKASLALFPEGLRHPVLEGLRGHDGAVGFAFGAAAMVLVGLAYAAALARGGAWQRVLLLGIVVDLALPVLSTGFVQRYAYLSSAFLALALGLAVERSTGWARRASWILALAWAALWSWDHVVDEGELRRAGRVVEAVLSAADRARQEVGAGVPIVLVDAPDHLGREDDVPVLNWGLGVALERAGIPGPWQLLRAAPCWTTSDHEPVDEARVRDLLDAGQVAVLVFEPEGRVRAERLPTRGLDR